VDGRDKPGHDGENGGPFAANNATNQSC
jgi:hypothetical protein